MDDALYFSDQHLVVREMVRDFAQTEIAPIARAADASAEFPWDNVKKMADLGLLGVPWDPELGGSGMDYLSLHPDASTNCAKIDASHATHVRRTPPRHVADRGVRHRRAEGAYVPLLASGRVIGGFGLTEPGAGVGCRWHADHRRWTRATTTS